MAEFDILEFEGRMNVDDFLDWLNTMEHVFEYCEPPEHTKLKLVSKCTRILLSNGKTKRDSMKEMVKEDRNLEKDEERKQKEKYLPVNYHQDVYLKIQNFMQRDLSMKYSAEFENLLIKEDLHESEEQVIHHLVGLGFNITRVIYLHSYHTLLDVMKLALKVEAINKYKSSTQTRSVV